MPIKCDIVTQERSLFSGEVDYISLPGVDGRMGILPDHSPMLTNLDFGEIMVRDKNGESFFAIGGGFAEIQPDAVTILVDSAERADEIDPARAELARTRARQAMEAGEREDPIRYAQIEAALRRAQIRIDVSLRRAGRRRRGTAAELRSEEENE